MEIYIGFERQHRTFRQPVDELKAWRLAALFPSGSVTGAPKIRAMQIIREIEDGPRRIHTGAIGFMTPDREMYFNVAIRTLLQGNTGEMGVGGGIVWDSTPQDRYEECRIKSAFLCQAPRDWGRDVPTPKT